MSITKSQFVEILAAAAGRKEHGAATAEQIEQLVDIIAATRDEYRLELAAKYGADDDIVEERSNRVIERMAAKYATSAFGRGEAESLIYRYGSDLEAFRAAARNAAAHSARLAELKKSTN